MTAQITAACLLAISVPAVDFSTNPVFQIRQIADVPSDQTEAMVLIHQGEIQTNTATFYVRKLVMLDQTALQSVKVTPETAATGARIRIDFTADGAMHFSELTRRSIGRRLAFIIDGQLCSAALVTGEVVGGTWEISGPFTEKLANNLASKITMSLRPGRTEEHDCRFVLVQIDGATQQWALEHNQKSGAVPTWSDIRPYLPEFVKLGTNGVPLCPEGGRYTLGRVNMHGEEGTLPTCSIGGPNHSLLSN